MWPLQARPRAALASDRPRVDLGAPEGARSSPRRSRSPRRSTRGRLRRRPHGGAPPLQGGHGAHRAEEGGRGHRGAGEGLRHLPAPERRVQRGGGAGRAPHYDLAIGAYRTYLDSNPTDRAEVEKTIAGSPAEARGAARGRGGPAATAAERRSPRRSSPPTSRATSPPTSRATSPRTSRATGPRTKPVEVKPPEPVTPQPPPADGEKAGQAAHRGRLPGDGRHGVARRAEPARLAQLDHHHHPPGHPPLRPHAHPRAAPPRRRHGRHGDHRRRRERVDARLQQPPRQQAPRPRQRPRGQQRHPRIDLLGVARHRRRSESSASRSCAARAPRSTAPTPSPASSTSSPSPPARGRRASASASATPARIYGSGWATGREGDLSYRASVGYTRYPRWTREVSNNRIDLNVSSFDQNLGAENLRTDVRLAYRIDKNNELKFGGGFARVALDVYGIGPFNDYRLQGDNMDVGVDYKGKYVNAKRLLRPPRRRRRAGLRAPRPRPRRVAPAAERVQPRGGVRQRLPLAAGAPPRRPHRARLPAQGHHVGVPGAADARRAPRLGLRAGHRQDRRQGQRRRLGPRRLRPLPRSPHRLAARLARHQAHRPAGDPPLRARPRSGRRASSSRTWTCPSSSASRASQVVSATKAARHPQLHPPARADHLGGGGLPQPAERLSSSSRSPPTTTA